MKDYQDALGHELYDYYQMGEGHEIIERDDGYIGVSNGPQAYFSEYKDWPPHQKKAMRYVKGKVLDLGCGAGRHSLYLQEKGFDVTGLDVSPLAIKVCKLRGLRKARAISVTEITPKIGKFDTLLMMGANFGLCGSLKRARWLLKRFGKITSEKGRIIAESRDVYNTTDPLHLQYQKFNLKRNRMAGQIRIRVRHKKYKTPWFDYLFVSKDEMGKILEGTGWEVKDFIDSEGPVYIAIIERV